MDKNCVLIQVLGRDISEPEFFATFIEAYATMKERYEIFSANRIGELNDDNAWCGVSDDGNCDWKIFEVG